MSSSADNSDDPVSRPTRPSKATKPRKKVLKNVRKYKPMKRPTSKRSLSPAEYIEAADKAAARATLMSHGEKTPKGWLKRLDDKMNETASSPIVWKYYEVATGDLTQWELTIGLREEWFLHQIAESRADHPDSSGSKNPTSPNCNDPTVEPRGALRVQEFHIAHAMMKFLAALKRINTITGAIREADIAWWPFHRWRSRYLWFNKLIECENAYAHNRVKEAAYQRAVVGIDKAIIYQGLIQTRQLTDETGAIVLKDGKPIVVPETVKEYSDSLMPIALAVTSPAAERTSVPGSDMNIAAQSMQMDDVRDKVVQRLLGRLNTTVKPEADKRGPK